MKKLLILLLIFSCALPVLAKKKPEETIIVPMTQLEKRQFQSRTYDAEDKVVVMKALLNVLQDEGYIVYNVNSMLGFIYAVKDFDTSDPNIDISKEFGFTKSRLNYNGIKVATIETTANVTEYGNNVRVRINFKHKLLNEYGNAQFINDVNDAEFYEEIYNKIDTAINLQKQINAKNQKTDEVLIKKDSCNDIQPEKIEKEPIIEEQSDNKQEIHEENTEKEVNITEENITQEEKIEKIPETVAEEKEKEEVIVEEKKEIKPEDKTKNTEDTLQSPEDDKHPEKESDTSVQSENNIDENKLETETDEEINLSRKERKEIQKLEKQLAKELEKKQKLLLKEEEKKAKQEAILLKELEKVKQ